MLTILLTTFVLGNACLSSSGLARQFKQAVHPWVLQEWPHLSSMGKHVVMVARATYNGGLWGTCMTTRPWPRNGTHTRNLYYMHPDVDCFLDTKYSCKS